MSANPELEPQYNTLNKHINKYTKPNNTQAFLSMAVNILIEALAMGLIHIGLYYLGWTIHCLNMVRFFIQFHDMAHFSFFSSIQMNKIFGHIIGVYVHFPFQMWRDGHNYHHRFFGNLDRIDLSQTILFTKKEWESWSLKKKIFVRIFRQPIVFFLFTVQYVWIFGVLFNCAKRYGVFSQAVFERILALAMIYFAYLLGLPALELYLSVHFAMAFGSVLFHLQHSVNMPYRQRKGKWDFTRAALEGSTYLEVPMLLKPFSNGIEYHHIHHLNTNVASYVIKECHENFNKQRELNWNSFHINQVDIWLSIKSMANVMLDQDNSVLLPFSYTHL